MNIAFVDLCKWDYDVDTPFERPLGGSQSALVYLSIELARRGHRVSLFSRTERRGLRRGVYCEGFDGIAVPEGLEAGGFDAAVFLNPPVMLGPEIRRALSTPLVLWTQHADDQPALAELGDPEVRAVWDQTVCVSDWHRNALSSRFGLDARRVAVMRNAIGPVFERMFSDARDLAGSKPDPLRVTYTSTPFRGLDVLLHCFGDFGRAVPGARLDVYSSMAVYQVADEDDPCKELYEASRNIEGIHHHGSLPQPELARALRSCAILGYPNTFPETSCIAVMEALAAGLHVVTTDCAALPETTLGFGTLVPEPTRDSEGLLRFAEEYGQALIEAASRRAREPQAFAERCMQQVRAVNETCTWRVRAREWEALLGCV